MTPLHILFLLQEYVESYGIRQENVKSFGKVCVKSYGIMRCLLWLHTLFLLIDMGLFNWGLLVNLGPIRGSLLTYLAHLEIENGIWWCLWGGCLCPPRHSCVYLEIMVLIRNEPKLEAPSRILSYICACMCDRVSKWVSVCACMNIWVRLWVRVISRVFVRVCVCVCVCVCARERERESTRRGTWGLPLRKWEEAACKCWCSGITSSCCGGAGVA